MSEPVDPNEPILIKKYGNRRLYDTSRSQYITLDDLSAIVRGGATIKVVEASSGKDLTRAVLLQVLLEQQDALSLLPVELLHAILRVQGTLEQAPFAAFLSAMTGQFLSRGNQVAQQFMNLMGGFPGYGAATSAPSAPRAEASTEPPAEEPPPAESPPPSDAPSPAPERDAPEIQDVRARMDALLKKLK